MSITSEQLAQVTARSGVLRAATGRAEAFGKAYELKADGSGQLIWDRPVATDGDPGTTVAWATVRE